MPRSYKDKLIDFEVTPPCDAWENISLKLNDHEQSAALSGRLFNYQALPPVDAWKNIEIALQTKESGVAVTLEKQGRFLRMAVAAAMLGAAILGTVYFTNNSSPKNSTALTSQLSPNSKLIEPDNSVATPPAIEPHLIEVPYEGEASVNKPSRNNILPGRDLQNAKVRSSLLLAAEPRALIAAKPIRNAAGDIIQDPEILNDEDSRYISITSPNGQQTKISSKFLNMVMFLNDDNDVDQVDGYFDKNFLESLTWKSRFRDWRNKIISTSFVPSSTNFMDILEFKDLITKDK